jgi:hypothetical protein
MRALEVLAYVLLGVGNVLALPIWYWLFIMPLVRLWGFARRLAPRQEGLAGSSVPRDRSNRQGLVGSSVPRDRFSQ